MRLVRSKEQEFSKLYDESFRFVYNYLYSRTFDAQLAEDLASDAFMRAWDKFDNFDPERAKFSTWVITIARNLMATHFRMVRSTTDIESVPEGMFSTSDRDDMSDRDQAKQLLSHLNEEERELVYLRYWLELSATEIADVTGLNPSTIRTRLHRAIGRMRNAANV